MEISVVITAHLRFLPFSWLFSYTEECEINYIKLFHFLEFSLYFYLFFSSPILCLFVSPALFSYINIKKCKRKVLIVQWLYLLLFTWLPGWKFIFYVWRCFRTVWTSTKIKKKSWELLKKDKDKNMMNIVLVKKKNSKDLSFIFSLSLFLSSSIFFIGFGAFIQSLYHVFFHILR